MSVSHDTFHQALTEALKPLTDYLTRSGEGDDGDDDDEPEDTDMI